MAKLSLVVVPSRKNADNTLTIQLKITNANTTAYIPTKFKISNERQFQNGAVVKHPQSAIINRELRKLLVEYEETASEITSPHIKASEIKKKLSAPRFVGDTIQEYAQKFIANIAANNQTSYAQNMGYTLKWIIACFGDSTRFEDLTSLSLETFEKFLAQNKQSPTTINIRMSHLKALLNSAINEGIVEYKIFPFRNYKMPTKNVRDLCISKDELTKLRDAEFKGDYARRFTIARDFFMLSFYCAGINFTDLLDATFNNDVLTFVRKKTAHRKTGSDNRISISIQPEARAILDKYLNKEGKIATGYNYSDNSQFRVYITKALNVIGRNLGFEKPLMYYSARKTFVQLGTELGIPLYILEYAIGHTIKEANNRPIFNYLKVMRYQADLAIRTIIDYSNEPEDEEVMIIPEWARRGKNK